eukprot:1435264-Pleurochrysis_carterae.AAC.1
MGEASGRDVVGRSTSGGGDGALGGESRVAAREATATTNAAAHMARRHAVKTKTMKNLGSSWWRSERPKVVGGLSDRRSEGHVKLCKRRYVTHGRVFALRASRTEDRPSKTQCRDQSGRIAVAARGRASAREGRG